MNARKILESMAYLFMFAVVANITPINAQTQMTGNTAATITVNDSTGAKDRYSILIKRSGYVTYTREPGDEAEMITTKARMSEELTSKFFRDLVAAMPLTNLPVEKYDKGDALGTRTYVSFDGQRSPDLGCSRDKRKSALYDDITLITVLFASKDASTTHPGENTPNRSITLDDDSKTIHVKVGETIALHLGTNYTWALAGYDQSVLDQHQYTAESSGTQGVFKVVSVGTSDIRAIGDPHCQDSKPNCGPTRNFKVTIIADQQ